MDKVQVIKWLVPIVVRLIAGYLVVKLGIAASEADSLAAGAGEALGAVAISALSIYTSVKGRKTLLNQPPPLK